MYDDDVQEERESRMNEITLSRFCMNLIDRTSHVSRIVFVDIVHIYRYLFDYLTINIRYQFEINQKVYDDNIDYSTANMNNIVILTISTFEMSSIFVQYL